MNCGTCGGEMTGFTTMFCPACEKPKAVTIKTGPVTSHSFGPSAGITLSAATTNAPLCSQREALSWCVQVEARIEPLGWHVGLTGGCLYKKGPRKDIDFIIYPHVIHSSITYTDADILNVVTQIGSLLGYYGSDIKKSAHYKDGKLLFKLGDDVDVFVFGV